VSDHSDRSGTVCPRCGVGCHLRPGEDAHRARGVAGPANPNGRLCRQGIKAYDIDADERLTRPSIRRDGELSPVSWATAYEHIADEFAEILDAHGPDALAFLGAPHSTNEENYLLQKLARMLGTNNVDNRARLCHAETARVLDDRLGYPATTSRMEDILDAEVILVAGANPAQRQPVLFNSFVRPAVRDGATLVHVDPVGNETTRLADVHIAPRPDTDATVFDLLSERVLERGGADRSFIDRRTRDFAAFEAALAEMDHGRAVAAAGVDEDTLDRVAGLLASTDAVVALTGTGIEGAPDQTSAAAALLHLLLLTGNAGRPGTGLFVLRGLVNEQGATDAGCVPDRLPGHRPVTDSGARDRVTAEWGRAPPRTPGKTATELLAAFGDEIRGSLVVGENPAISKREAAWIRERLDSLDFLVVVDLAPSKTTRHADVVLPAAAGVEKAGTVTNLDRRVQRLRPTAEPPGTAKPDLSILTALGDRLVNEDGAFAFSSRDDVFEEFARVAPTHSGCSASEIDAGGVRWPVDERGVLYGDRFETPDGRAQFGTVQPLVETDGSDAGRLRLVTGGRMSESSGEDPASDQGIRIHPSDARERGLESGDTALVATEETTVEAGVRVDSTLQPGTVYLHATLADPFLRRDQSTVRVERNSTHPL
jgi:formate dehydrogenase major subunit